MLVYRDENLTRFLILRKSRKLRKKNKEYWWIKPELFDGQRDVLNTWSWKINVYFHLLLIGCSQLQLNDQSKMNFASRLLTAPAYYWWYMKMMSQSTPLSWDDFKAAMITYLVLLIMLQEREIKNVNLCNVPVRLNTWMSFELWFWPSQTWLMLNICSVLD